MSNTDSQPDRKTIFFYSSLTGIEDERNGVSGIGLFKDHFPNPVIKNNCTFSSSALSIDYVIARWSTSLMQLKPWYDKIIHFKAEQRKLRDDYLNAQQEYLKMAIYDESSKDTPSDHNAAYLIDLEMDKIDFQLKGLQRLLTDRSEKLDIARDREWGKLAELGAEQLIDLDAWTERGSTARGHLNPNHQDAAELIHCYPELLDLCYQPLSLIHQMHHLISVAKEQVGVVMNFDKTLTTWRSLLMRNIARDVNKTDSLADSYVMHYYSNCNAELVYDFFSNHKHMVPSGLTLHIHKIKQPGNDRTGKVTLYQELTVEDLNSVVGNSTSLPASGCSSPKIKEARAQAASGYQQCFFVNPNESAALNDRYPMQVIDEGKELSHT